MKNRIFRTRDIKKKFICKNCNEIDKSKTIKGFADILHCKKCRIPVKEILTK